MYTQIENKDINLPSMFPQHIIDHPTKNPFPNIWTVDETKIYKLTWITFIEYTIYQQIAPSCCIL